MFVFFENGRIASTQGVHHGQRIYLLLLLCCVNAINPCFLSVIHDLKQMSRTRMINLLYVETFNILYQCTLMAFEHRDRIKHTVGFSINWVESLYTMMRACNKADEL